MDKVVGFMAAALQAGAPMPGGLTMGALYGEQKFARPEMVHKWCYSLDHIQQVVRAAGFEQIRIAEARYHFPIRDMRVEAVKPC